MSAARQFDQSPARYFVQSLGRQRNRGAFASDMIAQMVVAGLSKSGGYGYFINASISSPVFLHAVITTTGTTLDEDGLYHVHKVADKSWVHPIYGDSYKWEVYCDDVLTESWTVPEDWDGNLAVVPGYTRHAGDPEWLGQFALDPAPYSTETSSILETEYTVRRDSTIVPAVFREVNVVLSSPRSRATYAEAVAVMNGLDFTCNQSFTIADGRTFKTGLVDPLLLNFVVRGITRGYGPTVKNFIGGSVFDNSEPINTAGSYVVRGGISQPVPIPQARYGPGLSGFADNWWAGKLKVARGRPEVELQYYYGDYPNFTGPIKRYSTITDSPACEPCSTAPVANRCAVIGVFGPSDTYSPGKLYVGVTPPTKVTGRMYYDWDGDGQSTESEVLVLDGQPVWLTPTGCVEITIPGQTYYVTPGWGGYWGVQLPDNYSGPVTKRILTSSAAFIAAFTRFGYTGATQTEGTNPETLSASPSQSGIGTDFGSDGFRPT